MVAAAGGGGAGMARIVVAGAGIVGLCAALALQDRGHAVALVDRDEPGRRHASRWNAGVLPTSSLVPLANPGTRRRLPTLLTGREPGFRLDPRVGPGVVPWGAAFLHACRPEAFAATAAALHALIERSREAHARLSDRAGAAGLWRREGWLHLHGGPAPSAADPVYDRHGVARRVLDALGLAALEPSLASIFPAATLFPDTVSVDDPPALFGAYLALFRGAGGTLRRAEVRAVEPGPALRLADGERVEADHVVLAAGPWSAEILARAGLHLPLLSERGFAARFHLAPGAALNRPVFDVAGGIVLAPRPGGVQLSTGTRLTRPGAPTPDGQWRRALARARRILPLGEPIDERPATADRPTLPDDRPAVGPVPGHPGLWLSTGHQHIGFSTSAGSGAMLAVLVAGEADPLAAAFAPARVLRPMRPRAD